jgi:ornithine cyclodeaminase
MPAAIEVMREALRANAEGNVYQPVRTVLQPQQLEGVAVIMPAFVGSQQRAFGMKVVTFFPENPKRGIPAVSGFVALFDVETGVPVAVLDGGVLTEIRTGAVSGVATDALARLDAGDLALIGSGVQARAHLAAMAAVRPLRRIRVWNRNEEGARALAKWSEEQGHAVEVCATVRETVEGADLICTVTSSPNPLVDGDWVAAGTHINAVGAFQAETRELHSNVVAKARVVVDSREAAIGTAGDLLIPIEEGVLPSAFDYPELGELLLHPDKGRATPEEITIFESLGLALEDVAAAAHVVLQAHERELGVDVPF